MLAVTTPRVSESVDSAHRMIQATSADLPMPWPEATASRTASSGVLSRCSRPRPRLSSISRCQGSGPLSPASAVPARPQGKANCTKPRGSKRKRPSCCGNPRRRRKLNHRHDGACFRLAASSRAMSSTGVGGRIVGSVSPSPAAAVAQPEDAGLDVRRIVNGAGDRLHLAADDDRALEGAVVADRAGIEAARHARVGGDAAAAARRRGNRRAQRSIGRWCWATRRRIRPTRRWSRRAGSSCAPARTSRVRNGWGGLSRS